MICSNGYPDTYEKNVEIPNLDKILLKENEYLFHAGTSNKDDKIFAIGAEL